MNKIIEAQLNQIREADLSHFDRATNTYIIPKKTSIRLDEGKCYIIQLNKSLLKPSSVLKYLMYNWNKGVELDPSIEYYYVEINKINGNMVFINGVSYDIENKSVSNVYWSGWLPTNEFNILEKVEV